jgi:hypothetical protein
MVLFLDTHMGSSPSYVAVFVAVRAPVRTIREKGDFNKKRIFLNMRQRKNLQWAHSAWEPVDDQRKKLQ